MSPSLPKADEYHRRVRNAIFVGYRRVGTTNKTHLANPQDLIRRQFGSRVFLSNTRTPLFNHVSLVVGIRPEPKVVRIDTRWVVTTMTHAHASRNRPLGQGVGNAIRRAHLSTRKKHAASSPRLSRCPLPASERVRSLANFGPEPIRYTAFSHCALLRVMVSGPLQLRSAAGRVLDTVMIDHTYKLGTVNGEQMMVYERGSK